MCFEIGDFLLALSEIACELCFAPHHHSLGTAFFVCLGSDFYLLAFFILFSGRFGDLGRSGIDRTGIGRGIVCLYKFVGDHRRVASREEGMMNGGVFCDIWVKDGVVYKRGQLWVYWLEEGLGVYFMEDWIDGR